MHGLQAEGVRRAGLSSAKYVALSIAAVLLMLDRAAKWLAAQALPDGDWLPLPGVGLKLLRNTGIAFSLPLPNWLATSLIALLLLVFLSWAARAWRADGTQLLPLLMVVAGASSNLWDRLTSGAVIDFIQLTRYWPVFNLADAYVIIGLLMLWRGGGGGR